MPKYEIAMAVYNYNSYYINTLTALHSIFSNTDDRLTVHVFHDASLGESEQSKFGLLADEFSQRCVLHDFSGYLSRFKMYDALKFYSPASMFRLFIPEVFPERTILYLDSDICCYADVSSAFGKYLENADLPLWAVRSAAMSDKKKEYVNKIGLDITRYFNSGILVFHCNAINNILPDYMDTVCDLFNQNEEFLFPDQDILNIIFGKSKLLGLMPANLNFQLHYGRRFGMPIEKLKGKIVHYGSIKPWLKDYPAAESYWQERRKVEKMLGLDTSS